MTASAVGLGCVAVALLVLRGPRRVPAPDAPGAAAEAPPARPGHARDRLRTGRGPASAAALGLAVALVLGGPAGLAAGAAAAVGTHRLVHRLEPAAARRTRLRREAELPLVLDLLAVCLRAGMPLVGALETVAGAVTGPFSEDLGRVSGLLRLGSPPATAWADLADDPDLEAVVRAASRSAESGSRLASSFERLAAERRSMLAAAGEARARSAGVVAMAPLGLCFLPAFVSLGLVPIVLSLAAEVLP